MADFVHLHNHSDFSLLDGLNKISSMVKRVKALGQTAIAITDHGNMYGVIKFYQECKYAGIKPIIGCEIYVATRSLKDKEAGVDKNYNHLILLAKNETGYKNLMKIVSTSYLEGYYYKPRTDMELLQKYHEGLICLTACVNGYVTEPLVNGNDEEGERRAKKLMEIFGDGNLYLEIQRHIHVPPQKVANEKLVALSRKLGIPLVATNDNHYTVKEDAEAQEILLCIQTQNTIQDKGRKLSMIDSPDFYIKSSEEMAAEFKDLPEAIENTVKIAEMCSVEIELGKWHMPIFEVPDGKTSAQYLRELVYDGMKIRYPKAFEDENSEEAIKIKERVDYELKVIEDKGYETYFLVVGDFVNWAKDHGIAVGPGRGSAAGSVVGYCLRITDVDPFFFALPFERFLNPMRPSAPDIDLDFADTRREEVIKYVTQKYGEDKVAQIITFGTMEAKGSVKDAGRALGMSYVDTDRISKMIPPGWQGHAMTLDNAMETTPDLKHAYENEPATKKLIDIAKRLEGVARHSSVHAAGVVIADKPITEYAPVQKDTAGDKVVTQYEMKSVGEDGVGLLKMDFLGLRNLTIIEEAQKFIKRSTGSEVDFYTADVNDPKTYELLGLGETTGIFQLESAGMRRYIKELKPTTIFDLQAMVSLYRPGPMQNIPEFIKRKQNPKLITYPHPALKDILKESYGVLTFQDDVLLTAIRLAGYTWLDADKFRKAMGKKIPEEMKKQEIMFIEGCVKNGLSEKKAKELFELIAPFAGYGFNKAHAACYAMIAFRTAYLKAHFPVEFMTAVLTAESRGTSGPAKEEKLAQAIAECKRLGLTLLPPDVNFSEFEFSIEEGTKIRFGMTAVKNVGTAAVDSILGARKEGKFTSFPDFLYRVDLQKVNKKTIESLIKAGALDSFGKRATMLKFLESDMLKVARDRKRKAEGQGSFFDGLFEEEEEEIADGTHYHQGEEFPRQDLLLMEKELFGFYLTEHPLQQVLEKMTGIVSHKIGDLVSDSGDELAEEDDEVTDKVVEDKFKVRIVGIVSHIKKVLTKKNQSEMAILKIEDLSGEIECVVFPKLYELLKHKIIPDKVVLIDGMMDTNPDRMSIIVDDLKVYKGN